MDIGASNPIGPTNGLCPDIKPTLEAASASGSHERIILDIPPSPKLSQAEKRRSLYPYYAGFSEPFTSAMLDHLEVGEKTVILDPWNGSGTTTYQASLRGAAGIGCDLNPTLTLVARARVTTAHDVKQASAILDLLPTIHEQPDGDVITHCASIYEHATANLNKKFIPSAGTRALLLCAIFQTIHANFKHARTRNPTWFTSKAIPLEAHAFKSILSSTITNLTHIIHTRQSSDERIVRLPSLHTANFLKWRRPPCSIDAIMTSPPYLTRLDYVKATLPELLLLNKLYGINISILRTQMMGTPLVGRFVPAQYEPPTKQLADLLLRIAAHPSKASATYYSGFFSNYFYSMQRSLAKISKLLKPKGKLCLVVQSSYYKEIYIDLPELASDIARRFGLREISRYNYMWNSSIVGINKRATTATRSTTESAVVFEKQ